MNYAYLLNSHRQTVLYIDDYVTCIKFQNMNERVKHFTIIF